MANSNTELESIDVAELKSFIKHELDIDIQKCDSSGQTAKANLQLLDLMTKRYVERVPWNNLTYILRKGQVNRAATAKECMQSLEGGLCWTVTFLLKQLLVAVGFRAHMGAFQTSGHRKLDVHSVIFVWDVVSDGDVYLIDLGGAQFIPKTPVLLNTEEGGCSDVIQNCLYSERFVRRGEFYIQQQKAFDNQHHHKYSEEWVDCLVFKLGARSDDEVHAALNAVFTLNFLDDHFCKSLNALILKNGKMVMLYGNKLSIEGDSGKITDTELESGEAIIQALFTHFPMIHKDTVLKAVKRWCSDKKFPLGNVEHIISRL